ncbi:hypothetical protein HAX54_053485 [Datura stramonium]|uniref:RING-type E3 ubiquitin transferase n=1 Tax=Datura stramonium TaxID=4076 RepID=A0ABS8T168_DATST|nr:hypothetical protein [Datura stramonium]
MDKDFDLDLALTVVGISGGDTAEPPRCSTPSDDDNVSTHQKIVHQLPSVNYCEDVGLCIVCMEGFQRGVVVDDVGNGKQVPCCGHVFHANCLTKWLSVSNSCPLCRFNVSTPERGGSRIQI